MSGAGTSGSGAMGEGGADETGGAVTGSGGEPAPPIDAPAPPPLKDFCSKPGSIVFDANGKHVVGGGDPAPLEFLTLKPGYCAHHYAKIPGAREIRFAPGGEPFIASPKTSLVGGGGTGMGSIMIVPDDDEDGVGDTPIQFTPGLDSNHGFVFVPGYFYYQNDTQIRRVPYKTGDRTPIQDPKNAGELLADIQVYKSQSHWTKTLDMADDGTIYVTNGGDQGSGCTQPTAFEGGVLRLDGSPGGKQVMKGMRNPIRLRCQRGHNHCFSLELGRDSSASMGGREKLVPVVEGADLGHPCCATKNKPFTDLMPVPDCSKVEAENNSFVIGSTPFGFDFVPTNWPAPWGGGIIVALHGVFASWTGARVVGIQVDGTTGMPMHSSTIDPTPVGPIADFATGWDDNTTSHGRPTVATFAPDGRLFIGDDVKGEVFWIAPVVGN